MSYTIKGRKHSEEWRRHQSEGLQGHFVSKETRLKCSASLKGKPAWNKGKTGVYSEETKRKISEAAKRRPCSEERKEQLRTMWIGKHHSIETRRKMSEANKGNKCWNWKGGVSLEREKIRQNVEYRLWREAVFARDGWTCQGCKQAGGRIEAHHIKPFAKYPELRFAIDNGITLCKEKCHKKTHSVIHTKKEGRRL